MNLTPTLQRLVTGDRLSRIEARSLLDTVTQGGFEPVQLAGVLVAIQSRGATPEELAGFAEFLRESAVPLGHDFPDLIDTCGTGGGATTFNLSTGAAIVAASAGAKVAKHGNRSVTSKCGSADVLEALGVRLHPDPERLSKILTETGIVFLFAPHHHGSLRAVGEVRSKLGVRTVFNQLGPLANPAGAQRQLIGVYDRSLVRPMAEALALLGSQHAFVVHSEDGMDEASPCAPTWYAEVTSSGVKEGRFEPTDFLTTALSPDSLQPGSDVAENAKILASALDYSELQRALALVPNAALAVLLAGLAGTLSEAAVLARRALESGNAAAKLSEMVEACAT